MAKKLHNFDLPNPSLNWNTAVSSGNNSRTMRSPTHHPALHPSLISHHSELIPDHVPLNLLISEDGAKKPRIKIKLPCKNIDGVKGKDVVKDVGEKNDVESIGKEVVMVDAKKRDVRGKEKVVVRMRGEKDKKDSHSIDSVNEGMQLWNLRSRAKSSSVEVGKGKSQDPASKEKDVWARLNLDIALTPKQIEEDFNAMQIKPSTKIKKRPKSLQNIIDRISPGNNLTNISTDTYQVSANSMKREG